MTRHEFTGSRVSSVLFSLVLRVHSDRDLQYKTLPTPVLAQWEDFKVVDNFILFN